MHFLDPTNDIVFHRIFGDQHRTTSLISLINAVLGLEGDARVVEVSVPSASLTPKLEGLKDTIVDVHATDGRGHRFIVEMQCKGGPTWMKRALFTTCKAYTHQLQQGDLHAKLRPVYFIGILQFEMPWADVLEPDLPDLPRSSGPKSTEERQGRSWLTHHYLTDMDTQLRSSCDFSLHFIELPVFKKQLEDCSNVVEQWAWFFKHAAKAEQVPGEIKDEGIVQAFAISNEHGWSEEELRAVENHQHFRSLAASELEYVANKNHAEGMEKGIEQGRQAERKELAARLAASGMSQDAIDAILN